MRRSNAPLLITAVALILAGVATVTLRHAAPEIAAAAILVLVVIAGAGVGLSVGKPDARH